VTTGELGDLYLMNNFRYSSIILRFYLGVCHCCE